MSPIPGSCLGLRNRVRAALEFYQGIFGGGLEPRLFGDDEFARIGNSAEDAKIMHGQLCAPDGLSIMATDARESGVNRDFRRSYR